MDEENDKSLRLRERAQSEPLAERARLMQTGAADAPNGIRMVVVAVDNALDRAALDVHFFNPNYLDRIVAAVAADARAAAEIFPLGGGVRRRAGRAEGQVRVRSVARPAATEPVLQLTIEPVGDYSTYTLAVRAAAVDAAAPPLLDPLFSEIAFKFRPGCFNVNCAPVAEVAAAPPAVPVIDYLAKDYESFRRTMIAAMADRVPGWEPTSEADLDQVLLELFSAAADELSDFQDRVMNEAFLGSARRRVSLARHARLMDYHIHQGHQAATPIALEIDHAAGGPKQFELLDGLCVWTGENPADADAAAVVFHSGRETPRVLHQFLNRIGLYTWSGAIPTLRAGATVADLRLFNRLDLDGGASEEIDHATNADVVAIRELIRGGRLESLLIEERLNPATGAPPGRDPSKRQLLRLVPDGAEAVFDPVEKKWLLRVRWEKRDALRRDYCFTADCAGGRVEHVALFRGNLVEVFHGRRTQTIFREPGAELSEDPRRPLELYYERTRQGALCRLPEPALAYRKTNPGGDEPPLSTLSVKIEGDYWDETAWLVHSDDSDENGDHFVVETDENRRSTIRFGNGTNGRELPDGAVVECEYQYGEPLAGNVGADKLVNFDAAAVRALPGTLQIAAVRNPFEVTDGREREPVAEIVRRVPEAYRARQLRAVTPADYVAEAEKVAGVARAAARYAWTGSWRTVRVAIDPVGTNELSEDLRRRVAARLEAVRLLGEDVEIRPPRFVPLEIGLTVCVAPAVWIEDVRFALEREFSAGWLPDGRKGFFHPDEWTFGQPLYESALVGRALAVGGVEHVVGVSIRRFNEPTPGGAHFTAVRHNEIIEVLSDPDRLERGFIGFEFKGGRQ